MAGCNVVENGGTGVCLAWKARNFMFSLLSCYKMVPRETTEIRSFSWALRMQPEIFSRFWSSLEKFKIPFHNDFRFVQQHPSPSSPLPLGPILLWFRFDQQHPLPISPGPFMGVRNPVFGSTGSLNCMTWSVPNCRRKASETKMFRRLPVAALTNRTDRTNEPYRTNRTNQPYQPYQPTVPTVRTRENTFPNRAVPYILEISLSPLAPILNLANLYLWNYFILFLGCVASNSTSNFADFHKLWSCVHEPSMQKKENTPVCPGWAQSTHRIYGFKGCGVGLGICKGFDCQICARPLAAKWHDTGTAWLAASPKLQRALPGQLSHSVAATQSENWYIGRLDVVKT